MIAGTLLLAYNQLCCKLLGSCIQSFLEDNLPSNTIKALFLMPLPFTQLAFLKCKMDDFALMHSDGESVDVLCDMNPSHKPIPVFEHGKKVHYARVDKAIYGRVKSVLLW
jgi:hypothetical protein